ncbi:unnamed protein product, partial [Closterium sp. Naga37s-1]
HINLNSFYGTVPTTLINMPALSVLMMSNNYLTGVLPKPAATLKALGRGAGCSVCGSTNGQVPLCGGAVCTPDPSAYVASKVPNTASAPTLALKCPSAPLDANSSAAAVLNIGAALGVTHSDWSASSGCNLVGQTTAPKSWPGVWRSGNGTILSLTLDNMNLQGSIHADITKLNTLTNLNLGYNLLYGRLATFVSNITLLTAIVTLSLNLNYLYDSVPSTLLNMASLTELSVPLTLQAVGRVSGAAWLSLKSNLLKARLDEFAYRIPSPTYLVELSVASQRTTHLLLPPLLAPPCLAAPCVAWHHLLTSFPLVTSCLATFPPRHVLPCHLPPMSHHLPLPPSPHITSSSGLSYNYLTYRVPPLSANLKLIDMSFNFLSGYFPANSAPSCSANNNCLLATTTCTTGGAVQRSTGCSFCNATMGQGMLCRGKGICTPDNAVPLKAGKPNAVGAANLPMACISKYLKPKPRGEENGIREVAAAVAGSCESDSVGLSLPSVSYRTRSPCPAHLHVYVCVQVWCASAPRP